MKNILIGIAAAILPLNLVLADEVSSINHFVEQTKTYEAKFDQKLISPLGDVVEESEGEFFLQRPNKFRWNYDSPIPQEIIADGDKLWLFDKELDQVTVNALSTSMNPASQALLAGDSEELKATFDIVEEPGVRPGEKHYQLTPKDNSSDYEKITLTFRGEQLSGLALKDGYGQTTMISFKGIKVNDKLKKDIFNFKVPEGVDVVSGSSE